MGDSANRPFGRDRKVCQEFDRIDYSKCVTTMKSDCVPQWRGSAQNEFPHAHAREGAVWGLARQPNTPASRGFSDRAIARNRERADGGMAPAHASDQTLTEPQSRELTHAIPPRSRLTRSFRISTGKFSHPKRKPYCASFWTDCGEGSLTLIWPAHRSFQCCNGWQPNKNRPLMI